MHETDASPRKQIQPADRNPRTLTSLWNAVIMCTCDSASLFIVSLASKPYLSCRWSPLLV